MVTKAYFLASVTCVALPSWSAIRFTMDVKRVKIRVAPREDDLQRCMERGQRHIAANKEPAPDQWADPLHHDAELIDMRWDG
jgi:hypothetical protein